MMRHKYVDEQGNTVLAISTTVPVTFVPPGFKPEDAKPMSETEFGEETKKVKEHLKANPPKDKVALLTEELSKLQTDVEELKKQKP